MQSFIAKVGKGHKRAKDLTWDEAKEAMRHIIEGSATAGQIGAFLMAMRIKTESIGELTAFAASVRQYVQPLPVPNPDAVVDLPLYGEKHDTCHVAVAAAIVAAAAGATLFIHGNRNPASAATAGDILAHLGVPINLAPAQLGEQLAAHRLAYVDMELYHPPLAKLLDYRQEFGVQNLAHQLARMVNPTRAASQVIGVAHPPYLDKIIEALHMLGTGRALILHGVEGMPELSLSTTTPVRELRNDHISRLMIRPQDVGFAAGSFHAMSHAALPPGASIPEREAKLVLHTLEPQSRGDYRQWVILNAALLLYAGGTASSVMQAAPLATQALDSGRARQTLRALSSQAATDIQTEHPSTPTHVVSA